MHRYPDRVLLKLVHVCAVYCRFCFRREMVGPARQALTPQALDGALGYIGAHPEIWEVILTGGDPLVLSPRRLGRSLQRLAAIDHVKVIRLHTRVPVVDAGADHAARWCARSRRRQGDLRGAARQPSARTDARRARRLRAAGRCRHPDAEPDRCCCAASTTIAETLGALMRAFVESRIKPYYLHHADLAPGTAHLRTTIAEGQALMRALRGRLSGLCQPAYVLDIPGGHGKSPIGPNYLSDGGCMIEDFNGRRHVYPPAR